MGEAARGLTTLKLEKKADIRNFPISLGDSSSISAITISSASASKGISHDNYGVLIFDLGSSDKLQFHIISNRTVQPDLKIDQ